MTARKKVYFADILKITFVLPDGKEPPGIAYFLKEIAIGM
jgi:hypothetical protein